MKNKKYSPVGMKWGCLGLCIILTACGNTPSAAPAKSHLAAVSRPGATLYVDHLDNRVVLKEEAAPGSKTIFCTFLVGWQDSTLLTDKKKIMAREKYFQYDMQKDWTVLVKGDTLIYKDSFGGWDRQVLVLANPPNANLNRK